MATSTYSDYTLPYPDTSRGPLVRRTVWSLLSISTLVLGARLYVKARKTRRLYWDDLCMTLALLFGYAHAVCINISLDHGLGRHMAYLAADERGPTLKYGEFSLAWAFLSPMAGRIGFCVTLLFLTGTDPRVKKWPIYMFIFLQLAANISTIVVFYCQCGTNLDILWTPSKLALYETHCWDSRIQTDYGYFQGSMNTLTDAFLAILPAVLIEHTRLSLKSKITLGLCLCLSVIAMTASIVKTYEARVLSSPIDYTYDMCAYVIWLSVELNIVIIVSSVPLLRPLFVRRSKQPPIQVGPHFDSVTLGSVFSKNRSQFGSTTLNSNESEENLAMPPRDGGRSRGMRLGGMDGITVTKEVSVTYGANDKPFVHAALVGLVQGEIAQGQHHGHGHARMR